MKRLLLCVLLVTASFAAQGPAQIDAPRLVSITLIPVYGKGGRIHSLNAVAVFTVMYVHHDGETKARAVTVPPFDLIEAGKQNVTIAGVVYDYDEVGLGIILASVMKYYEGSPTVRPVPTEVKEFYDAHLAPPPVRRRALREPQAAKAP